METGKTEIPTVRVPYKEKVETRAKKEFPVLIGIPVPSIDHKINSGLSAFVSAAAARHIGIQWTPDARLAKCGRNLIIDDFLHQKDFKRYDYLLFMDHDCYPVNPFALERLIALNKDVVAGVTPIMFERYGEKNIWFNVQIEDGKNLYINELPKELFRARRVGGTCILIKRAVLEAMEPPYQMDTFDEKHISFATSEDYYFCDKIRANGYDIWVDPEIWNHHYHNIDLLEILTIISRIVGLNKQPQLPPEVVQSQDKIREMAEEK